MADLHFDTKAGHLAHWTAHAVFMFQVSEIQVRKSLSRSPSLDALV